MYAFQIASFIDVAIYFESFCVVVMRRIYMADDVALQCCRNQKVFEGSVELEKMEVKN
ncbi:hypothetical protein KD050_06605 [Psychrobacillus sp. INOP01]|uniref:hypothetical protein n=1 Tax=Psychrobacillus sp. INOP01 TaxID=2829187 RepID=UPI001BACC61E|nr:hypothetical protein [Psychrobacillus sp. INOP01]QUG42912.1 hypothetical protein KD050_06605 [Psychrobacillus sp. INOP01]